MGLYCGCGTGANRIRWLIFIVLFGIATFMAVVYCLEAKRCRKCDEQDTEVRMCEELEFGDRVGVDELYECNTRLVFSTGTIFFFAFLISWIPCCCMCCCSEAPDDDDDDDKA